MLEIRFHGRGGQGAVIASKILASAVFLDGRHVQSFPAFGVERRGAPVTAFIRIDDNPILLRTEIKNPDHVVVLDSSLLLTIDVTTGLKEGGIVLINSKKSKDAYRSLSKFKVFTVDASAIALKNKLGSKTQPIVNTSILGAISALGWVRFESVAKAISDNVPISAEANVEAARQAAETLREKL